MLLTHGYLNPAKQQRENRVDPHEEVLMRPIGLGLCKSWDTRGHNSKMNGEPN